MPSVLPETLPLPVKEVDRADSDLLRELSWNDEPKRLSAASKAGDVPMFAREARRELRRRFGGKRINPAKLAARFPLYQQHAVASYTRIAEPGIEAGNGEADTTCEMLRLVALLDGLRRGGSRLTEDALWPLWSDAWRRSAAITREPSAAESPLASVLQAEALLSSGILFDGAAGMRARRKEGRARLLVEVEARTDSDGTPHADILPILPAWFASLVRSAHWAKASRLRLWNAEFSGRFDGLLRAIATMTTGEGQMALSGAADVRPVLAEAMKCTGWKQGSPVADLISRLRKGDAKSLKRAASQESTPNKIDRSSPPVVQSDWAKLVVSRSRWRPAADLLAISHAAAIPVIEFAAFGKKVLAGRWDLRVRIDDIEVELSNDCDAVSWFSDKDADYVELQWTTEPGLIICRQALLTRGDHQLYVADCVSTPQRPASRIEIEAHLPLATGVTGEALRPGRELRLNADSLPVRCFPIALPMDRINRGTGSLEPETGSLVVKQSGVGGVYSPLLFDWNPRRSDLPADWRSLTITENGRRLGPAEASASRVRIGKRQLLAYRNLNGSKVKRAVLGHHHDHESVIGRFTATGEVDPLVYVE